MTGLRKTSILDAMGSSFQSLMNSETERAEDLFYSELPSAANSIFGEVIDFITKNAAETAKYGLGREQQSFLEMRYYIKKKQSERSQRSKIDLEEIISHDYCEAPLPESKNYSPLCKTTSLAVNEFDEASVELKKTNSHRVLSQIYEEPDMKTPKFKEEADVCYLLEFMTIFQELVQVHLSHVNNLLKVETNFVRRLDLYYNMVVAG